MPLQNGCSVKPNKRGRTRSNAERKQDTTKAIRDKVLALEAVARRDQPLTAGMPTSMHGFRSWTDPVLGLTKIGSPSSTDSNRSPHNGELIERAYEAMRQISKLLRLRKLRVYVPVGTQLAKVNGKLLLAEEENRRLGSEVLRLKHLYDTAAQRLRTAEADRDAAKTALNALRAEHVAATNAKPRRIK